MNELHLLPQDERGLFFKTVIDTKKIPFEVIEKDYGLMRAMFFREVPAWELFLKTVKEYENEFNNQ